MRSPRRHQQIDIYLHGPAAGHPRAPARFGVRWLERGRARWSARDRVVVRLKDRGSWVSLKGGGACVDAWRVQRSVQTYPHREPELRAYYALISDAFAHIIRAEAKMRSDYCLAPFRLNDEARWTRILLAVGYSPPPFVGGGPGWARTDGSPRSGSTFASQPCDLWNEDRCGSGGCPNGRRQGVYSAYGGGHRASSNAECLAQHTAAKRGKMSCHRRRPQAAGRRAYSRASSSSPSEALINRTTVRPPEPAIGDPTAAILDLLQ
jgi:hypothetical protein